jgi:hypothetical protein
MFEMSGMDRFLSLQDDPAIVRKQRFMIHKLLGTRASVNTFIPSTEAVTLAFLRRMVDSPQDYAAHHV